MTGRGHASQTDARDSRSRRPRLAGLVVLPLLAALAARAVRRRRRHPRLHDRPHHVGAPPAASRTTGWWSRCARAARRAFPSALIARVDPDEVPYPAPAAAVAAEVTVAAPAPGTAVPTPWGRVPGARPFADLIATSAAAHGVDVRLVHAVIEAESNYQPRARSAKGAKGLMQLMPATARQYAVRDPYDPRDQHRRRRPAPEGPAQPVRRRPGAGRLQRGGGHRPTLRRAAALRRNPELRLAASCGGSAAERRLRLSERRRRSNPRGGSGLRFWPFSCNIL